MSGLNQDVLRAIEIERLRRAKQSRPRARLAADRNGVGSHAPVPGAGQRCRP